MSSCKKKQKEKVDEVTFNNYLNKYLVLNEESIKAEQCKHKISWGQKIRLDNLDYEGNEFASTEPNPSEAYELKYETPKDESLSLVIEFLRTLTEKQLKLFIHICMKETITSFAKSHNLNRCSVEEMWKAIKVKGEKFMEKHGYKK